jgi:hypothetical protein
MRRKDSAMDPYTAGRLLDYNRQELVKLRGFRKWSEFFRR